MSIELTMYIHLHTRYGKTSPVSVHRCCTRRHKTY